jgi:hypothetical protein
MKDHNESEENPATQHKRGWSRFFFRALLVLGVLLLLAFFARWQIVRVGRLQLEEMTTQLDAEDPGWRLEDIEAARQKAAPPEEKNPSTIILALSKNIPLSWDEHLSSREWQWGPVLNYHPSFVEFVWIVGEEKSTSEAREALRRQLLRPEILACPAGHYDLKLTNDPFKTLLPNTQNARRVAALLDYDVRLLVTERKANQAITSARAGLVVAKSIGDEPFLISQLVRIACDRIAVQSAMQILAWSEPKEGLEGLQKELRAEADVPWLQYGIRGERGMLNQFFEGLRSGTITAQDFEAVGTGPLQKAGFFVYGTVLPRDQAKALEIMTQFIEASKLPPHQQKAALAEIQIPAKDYRYLLTRLLLPACEKVADAALRCRAALLCGSVAIACERYRIKYGHWPETLSDIPLDILPDIPIDPFNGKPIQYLKSDDGVTIFSVGDGRSTSRDTDDPVAPLGQGWRLWNPKLRYIPSPPKVNDELPENKEKDFGK